MPAIIALVPPDATKAPRRMDSTPLNPKGRELRRMEREGTERIHAALEKWGRSLFRGVTAETVALITARLDDPEYSKPLRDVLIAFLQDTADAGAEFGRKQVEQVFMGVKRTPVLDAGAVDWTVANADAAQWAIEYGYQLIGGITDTTRAQVAREIRYFVDNSITVNQLRDRLMAGNLFSRNRASMIAVTETTRAYASGNEAAWRASQVVEGKEWMTAYDEAVCPICAPLSGKIVKLNESFGRVDKPPAHVNCRCWIVPVVIGDTEVLSEVGVGPWGNAGAVARPVYTPPPTFKTNAEAEAWVRENLIDPEYLQSAERWNSRENVVPMPIASFRGISVEAANEIVRTIHQMQMQSRVPKVHAIVTKIDRKGTWVMRTTGRVLEINPKYKTLADFADDGGWAAQHQALIDSMPALEAAEKAGTLTERQRKLLEIGRESAKYSRAQVSTGAADIVTHEMGHVADIMGHPVIGMPRDEWQRAVADAGVSMLKSGKNYSLSEYPTALSTRLQNATAKEMWAEAWTAYHKGERLETLTQEMIDLIERYIGA